MKTVYENLYKINIENNVKILKSAYIFKTKKTFEIRQTNLFLLNAFTVELKLLSNIKCNSFETTKKKDYQNLKFLNLLYMFKSINKDIPFQYLFEKKNHNFFFQFFRFLGKR